MKRYVYACLLCLVIVGCSRDLTEYDLDERSFRAGTLAKIENESRIKLPAGAKGLRFHHVPPIDPIVFAKIEIPEEAATSVETQIAALTKPPPSFPDGFANERCKWWPAHFDNPIASNQVFDNRYYIEAHLVRENGKLILYLKYFTI